MKVLLDGAEEVCILGVMSMTKNTNKATRQWVDSILSQLDLVLCEYSYRDCCDRLRTLRLAQSSESEVKEFLTANGGCITKSEHNRRVSLSSSNSLMETIETV
jgi:hypothetical protein